MLKRRTGRRRLEGCSQLSASLLSHASFFHLTVKPFADVDVSGVLAVQVQVRALACILVDAEINNEKNIGNTIIKSLVSLMFSPSFHISC